MDDIQHMIDAYSALVAEKKLGSYDTNPESSTKLETIVRENGTDTISPGGKSSTMSDPPQLFPHQEIAKPHIAHLESNLEKMEDTVASTQVENVEVEERSRAHEESSAGTTPYQLRRDHTAGIVREMDRPEEERLDRTIPRSPRIIQADIRIVSIDDEDILRRERTRGDSGGYNGLF